MDWQRSFGQTQGKRNCGQLVANDSLLDFPPGSLLKATLSFRPPFRAAKDLFSAQLDSPLRIENASGTEMSIFSKTKEALRAKAKGLTPDSRALVLGLSIGDDSQVSTKLRSDLKVISLTHLTAVSGANCAIVIAGAYFIFAILGLRNRSRFLGGATALIGYVALVGPQPSVLRSGVMALIVLAAVAMGRGINGLVALALSVVILLIYDPWLSQDLGFALSVSATAGLLLVAPAIYAKLRLHLFRWLAAGISVSVAAQIMCFPILLQLQSGFSSYAVLANLLVEPVVAPVTVLGIIASALVLAAPIVSASLTFLASFGTLWIIYVTDAIVSWPGATLAWPTGLLGILLAILLCGLLLAAFRSKAFWIQKTSQVGLAVFLMLAVALLSSTSYRFSTWPSSGWQVVSCDVGQGDATVLQSAGHYAVIDVGREPTKIGSCLNRLGIRRIDLLVLTHYDLDHVGGLEGALKDRQVDRILISGFEDDRPGAKISMRRAIQSGAQITVAETGMTGRLSDVSWVVLSPHRGAAEAEDSNDGSVTMLFQFDGFSLMTLADLGEKGQMRLADEWNQWHSLINQTEPLVLKVAHHGSADTYPEFIEALHPEVALISVGKNNGYGHPTKRALDSLRATHAQVLRTDLLGSIALYAQRQRTSKSVNLRIRVSGAS